MKGSDKVEMTINIGGEFLKLTADFDEQNAVRDAEFAVKQYCNRLRRNWPESSDRQILAMAAYQFARWNGELLNDQKEALRMVSQNNKLIESCLLDQTSAD